MITAPATGADIPGSTMANTPPKKQRVAVVYHFFAHYRAGVMRRLFADPNDEYVAVGDTRDFAGKVKSWEELPALAAEGRFIHAPCRLIGGRIMWQRGLLRLAVSRRWDTIIYLGNYGWPATWLSALLARMTGKRVLFWTHGWKEPESGVRGLVRRAFYRLAHGLLLYGHFAKLLGMQAGFRPERLYVIYNSLDYETQRALRDAATAERDATRRRLFQEPDRPLILFVGRLIAGKSLSLLLEAMHLLRGQGTRINLLLVGGGPEEQPLKEQARAGGLDVHFHGPCYDEAELARIIGAADLAVVPGDVGLTAIHCLTYGTPLLIREGAERQGPEWEAVIPGRTGGTFRAGDAQDLARALAEWIVRLADPDERQRVRAACFEIIDRFWNPQAQAKIIGRAVHGLPANDLPAVWDQPDR